jgi:uncharacterized protein with von Willebrand factor type A (vWA) domain
MAKLAPFAISVPPMFLNFFHDLRQAKIPVTLKEYLAMMEGLDKKVIDMKVDEFYYFSRVALVKDERNLDKFDRVFAHAFKGMEALDPTELAQIPEDWLKALTEKYLTEEEKKQIESLGGWDKLMEELKKRLEEQKKRHEGGNKAIGTGGTSPFGAYGYNPEGIRMGQDKGRHGKAVKVWDKREYKNLDDSVELGTRNIKIALRRLRKWAREGDIGGSMDAHIKLCEELFSAARTEFKHMDFYYFHNCVYESLWKDNRRRHNEKTPTWDVLHKYPHDYKVVIVGDATMSPYEITYPGGSVEHWNEEPGAVWLERLTRIYEHVIWLNPVPERHWEYTPSIQIMKQIVSDRMYPLTLEGLDRAMRELNR